MELLILFIDICLFKRGPQDVPASWLLFALALIAYLVVGELLLILETNWLEAGLQAAVEAILLLSLCWLLLFLSGKRSRFLQTATALLAADAIISTPGALILQWWTARPEIRQFQVLLFALMLWHVSVIAHILRNAVSRPLLFGVALAVLYIAVTYQIMAALFAPAVGA